MKGHQLDNMLAPLLDMRLVCNHPQLVLKKSTFMAQDKEAKKHKLFTMTKSLQMMMKKTRNECEHIYRLWTMNSNAIAGIFIIQKEFAKAIECYQNILDSEEKEYNGIIKMDNLQKIHATFNFIYAIQASSLAKLSDQDRELIDSLNTQLTLLEKKYTFIFEEKKKTEETRLLEKAHAIDTDFIKVKKISKCKWSIFVGF